MSLITLAENLLNSGAKSMAVDGSSVNKTFSYSPSSGAVAITKLVCVLDDPGSAAFNKFGSLTALTNGLLLSITISGVTTNLTTIKDNGDLTTRFSDSHFGNSASDTLGGAVGFGESYDAFIGVFEFPERIILKDSDSIQVVVRDNLQNISTLVMACVFLKEV